MIYHSLTKSILFFSAGNCLLKYGSTKIDRVRGVLETLPGTGKVLFITAPLILACTPELADCAPGYTPGGGWSPAPGDYPV